MNSCSSNEMSCGNCQYWQGVRARKGDVTIFEGDQTGNCPMRKEKRSCRQTTCNHFTSI